MTWNLPRRNWSQRRSYPLDTIVPRHYPLGCNTPSSYRHRFSAGSTTACWCQGCSLCSSGCRSGRRRASAAATAASAGRLRSSTDDGGSRLKTTRCSRTGPPSWRTTSRSTYPNSPCKEVNWSWSTQRMMFGTCPERPALPRAMRSAPGVRRKSRPRHSVHAWLRRSIVCQCSSSGCGSSSPGWRWTRSPLLWTI